MSSPRYKAIIDDIQSPSKSSKQHGPARKNLSVTLASRSSRPLASTAGLISDAIQTTANPQNSTQTPSMGATRPNQSQPEPRSPTHGRKNEETRSMIGRPFRVDTPAEMRCPPRRENGTIASTSAGSASLNSSNGGDGASAAAQNESAGKKDRTMVADYQLLAAACHRGGRIRGEAFNYFCSAVLFDNLQEFGQAVLCYQKHLALCRQSGDRVGELLSCNAIGVALQLQGLEHSESAISFHQQHMESPSLKDKFMAHTNLGLIYSSLSQVAQSAIQHQHALRYAIRLGAVALQSVAIGNLGVTGSNQRDYVTAKACMERYLELSSTLHDTQGLTNAHHSLGQIAHEQGEFKVATEHFHSAMRTAQNSGDKSLEKSSKVNLGVSLGNTLMRQHMEKMAGVIAPVSPSPPVVVSAPARGNIDVPSWSVQASNPSVFGLPRTRS